MFELLSDIQSVPIHKDSLAMVHRGMNKVRVSVGDHISEPSEVYIITGQVNGDFESYVIFYMLEPEIRVVYGCDKNPYPASVKDQVIEEATIFVEEMGSILEEVPWQDMTPVQREAWIEKEILYSQPFIEEIEELQEIEEGVVEDAELAEEPEYDVDSGFVEVSEDELQQVLEDSEEGELPQVLEGTPADEIDENGEEASEVSSEEEPEGEDDEDDSDDLQDVVVAEGDFDELLKQAFLKPDVAEKTKRKIPKFRRKEPPPEDLGEETGEEFDEDDLAVSEAESDADLEEMKEAAAGPMRRDPPVHASDVHSVSAKANETISSEKETRLKVVRFLSRF